jgi:lipopolysaccharide export system permease protein
MPTVWRFLLNHYLMVLSLCLVAFIAILLTLRLDEIAQFAALGANSPHLLKFVAYQIPYILPVAIPISALISTVILMQRLSSSYELTALRACGYSLAHIAAPLLLMAFLLSTISFALISEVSTHSQLMKRSLKREIKALNPLVLLQNEKLSRLQGIYAHAEGGLKSGEEAEDLVIARYNRSTDAIDLLLVKKVLSEDEAILAHHATLISSSKGSTERQTIIENAESVILPTWDLSQLLGRSSEWYPKDDYLKLSLLRARIAEYRTEIAAAEARGASPKEIKKITHSLQACYSEAIRRASLSLSVLSFTLIGIAFGTRSSPRQLKRGLLWIVGLATLFLVCFFTAKSLHHHCYTSMALYTAPHIVIIACCWRSLHRLSAGRLA